MDLEKLLGQTAQDDQTEAAMRQLAVLTRHYFVSLKDTGFSTSESLALTVTMVTAMFAANAKRDDLS